MSDRELLAWLAAVTVTGVAAVLTWIAVGSPVPWEVRLG